MGSVLEGLTVEHCYVGYVSRGDVMFNERGKTVLTVQVTRDEGEALGLGGVVVVVHGLPDQVVSVVEFLNLARSRAIIGTIPPY